MTWNNRIFKRKDVRTNNIFYGVHETFYDKNKKVDGYTENPIFGGSFESPEELIASLEQILNDVKKSKNDILDYDEGSFE